MQEHELVPLVDSRGNRVELFTGNTVDLDFLVTDLDGNEIDLSTWASGGIRCVAKQSEDDTSAVFDKDATFPDGHDGANGIFRISLTADDLDTGYKKIIVEFYKKKAGPTYENIGIPGKWYTRIRKSLL